MEVKTVEVYHEVNQDVFDNTISRKRNPCVIKDFDIGPCKTKWTCEYLSRNGGDKTATVHVSDVPSMNFIDKNFGYHKLPFCEMVKRASEKNHDDFISTPGEFYYFRSLGEDVRKSVSDINVQFPELAKDINFPPFIAKEKVFSSIFRIASEGMQLWTHYDVMDNFLIQVGGKKRVVLFPPSDVLNLYLKGDKSKIIDIDNPDYKKFPKFANATRYECTLNSGDILFIPALWFHNVIALEFGVAVNMFWKNLYANFYDNKDVYGNKDLQPASRSMDILNRALKVLNELPEEYKDFYARKMIAHIEQKALSPI